MLNKLVAIYKKKDCEKSSPFECAFNPIKPKNQTYHFLYLFFNNNNIFNF